MKMKKLLLLIFLVSVCTHIKAQNFEWAYRWNSVNGFTDTDVDVDNNGNVYIVSYGGTTVNFNMTTNNINSVYGPTFGCAAVTKLDAAGNMIWVKFITQTGATSGGCSPRRIKVKNGFIYVAGTFGGGGGSYDFDPNSGTAQTGGSNPNLKGFLLKWDLDGNYVWHKVQTSTIGLSLNSLDIDNSNNPIICGSFFGSLYSGTLSMTSNGGHDAFIIKYDSAGNTIFGNNWGSSAWNNPTNESKGVTTDQSGNVYVTGNFNLTIDVDPSAAISNLTSNGNSDVFVIKYSQTGNLIWAKSFGGLDNDQGNDINISGSGNICIVGMASGNVDFNPSISMNTLISTGAYGYLLEWDSNSIFSFVKGFLPSNSQSSCSMKELVIHNSEIFISGIILGSVDIDPSAASNIVSSGSSNTVLTRLSNTGAFIWGGVLNNQDSYTNEPLGMATSNGAFYTAGSFKGVVDFNPDMNMSYNLSSLTSSAGMPQGSNYILKIGTCSTISNTMNVSSCGQYVWNGQTYTSSGTYVQNFQNIAGCDSTVTLILTINSASNSSFSASSCEPYTWNGNIYASSGQYSQTLTGSNGCDSVVTLNLTILNGPTAQVTQDGLLLTANNVPGATYQWIYCSDLTPVPNQTFIQFAPQVNGTYAVVITDNCGSDTSDCITISTIGIDELNNYFSVYPNPTISDLNVSTDILGENTYFEIYDLNNRLIKSGNVIHDERKIDVNSLSSGVYILKLDNTSAIRFVKQ